MSSISFDEYAQYDLLRQEVNASEAIPLVPHDDDSSIYGRNLHYVPSAEEILCHVPIMFRWTSGNSVDGFSDVSSEAYGGSVAAAMAVHHFNTGNPTIVDELNDLPQTCPIRLTTEFLNSYSSGQAAMQQLTSLLTRNPNSLQQPQPCALLGSSWSSVTKKLATVTGVYDLPHTTSSASSVDLDDMSEYPTFTRTHPSDASMARLSLDYLQTQLGVNFVGVLYLDNAFGNAYQETLLKVANEKGMQLQSESFRAGATDDEVRLALQRLENSQYNYFLGVFFGGDYERIMTIAYELGMAGPGKFWMFNGALASKFVNGITSLPKDSPAALATYGNAILTDEGGLPGVNIHHDRFLKEWKSVSPTFLEYIHSKQPSVPGDSDLNFNRTTDFFTSLAPSHIAAFSYDAIISLGLAACRAYQEHEEILGDEEQPRTIFSGAQHHAIMTSQRFMGASGDVKIGPDTFSRTAESTYHVVFNILPVEETRRRQLQDQEDEAAEELVSFKGTPLTVFDTSNQQWAEYATTDFVYPDGTTTAPQQIPALSHDAHEISTPVRVTCLTLSGLAILLSMALYGYCCVRHRQHRVIKASQPFFLGMICAGTLLMASSIIPASLDDAVMSERGCDIACVIQFWLFPMGFCLVFSALFSKLWRISILLSQSARFQRIRVETRDVMIPFCALLGMNLVILTTWTIMDPPQWIRETLEYDDFGRISESTGSCVSDSMVAFLTPLLVVNGCALLLALWQSYVCRNVSTDFSESKYIAMATVCIFQALFMGVPIIFIVEDQPSAFLFVYTGVIAVICFSILLLIFVPKIQEIHRKDSDERKSSFFASAVGQSGAFTRGGKGGGTRISMSGQIINNNGVGRQRPHTNSDDASSDFFGRTGWSLNNHPRNNNNNNTNYTPDSMVEDTRMGNVVTDSGWEGTYHNQPTVTMPSSSGEQQSGISSRPASVMSSVAESAPER